MNNLIFAVTTTDVLKALSLRTDISTLSPEEIDLACQKVKATLETELDIRPYIDMGLDVWEIALSSLKAVTMLLTRPIPVRPPFRVL